MGVSFYIVDNRREAKAFRDIEIDVEFHRRIEIIEEDRKFKYGL